MCIFLLSMHVQKEPELHELHEVLVLRLYPQTPSPTVFHRNQKLLDTLPPAHWGECRKQLEKQIVAGRLSPGPLTLTHDWSFTWMEEALPLLAAVEKHQGDAVNTLVPFLWWKAS